jgi:hypothetical protein
MTETGNPGCFIGSTVFSALLTPNDAQLQHRLCHLC